MLGRYTTGPREATGAEHSRPARPPSGARSGPHLAPRGGPRRARRPAPRRARRGGAARGTAARDPGRSTALVAAAAARATSSVAIVHGEEERGAPRERLSGPQADDDDQRARRRSTSTPNADGDDRAAERGEIDRQRRQHPLEARRSRAGRSRSRRAPPTSQTIAAASSSVRAIRPSGEGGAAAARRSRRRAAATVSAMASTGIGRRIDHHQRRCRAPTAPAANADRMPVISRAPRTFADDREPAGRQGAAEEHAPTPPMSGRTP